MLLSELLGQGGRHELPLEAGRGREVRLARLAAVRSEAYSFRRVSVCPRQHVKTSGLGRVEAEQSRQVLQDGREDNSGTSRLRGILLSRLSGTGEVVLLVH